MDASKHTIPLNSTIEVCQKTSPLSDHARTSLAFLDRAEGIEENTQIVMVSSIVLALDQRTYPSLSLCLRLLNHRVVLVEVQRDTVDAVTFIRGCIVSFSFEHMSQVSAAVGADNLSPLHAKCSIGMASDGSLYGIKVRWPAASRLELVVCLEGKVNIYISIIC